MASKSVKAQFPSIFPFWARIKIGKRRTTLVIDKDKAYNKQKKRYVDGYVHREAIHLDDDDPRTKSFEKVLPNPDRSDSRPMYLKKATKLPQFMFIPHNKQLDMPEHLRLRYSKNNKK